MFLTESTVKTHINRMFAKLGVRDRVQAVVLAHESGFVVPGVQRLVAANTIHRIRRRRGDSSHVGG